MAERETVLVTGYARAPKGTPMYEQYKLAGAILEIDPAVDVIVDAEFTFLKELSQRFLRDIVRGYCLRSGVEPLTRAVEQRYLAPSQQAYVQALRAAVRRYEEWRAGDKAPDGQVAGTLAGGGELRKN